MTSTMTDQASKTELGDAKANLEDKQAPEEEAVVKFSPEEEAVRAHEYGHTSLDSTKLTEDTGAPL